MKKPILFTLLIFLTASLSFLPKADKIRKPVDPVGFATKGWQMDQLMLRINQKFGDKMEEAWNRNRVERFTAWKTVISPHDDYTYASWLYPAILKNVKANTVILIGVAHKAKKFNIEDKIVFDNYDRRLRNPEATNFLNCFNHWNLLHRLRGCSRSGLGNSEKYCDIYSQTWNKNVFHCLSLPYF